MMKLKTIIVVTGLLLGSMAVQAQQEDTVMVANTAFVPDSTEWVEPLQGELLTSKIHLKVRTYGDRVYLRWVPEDYVSWLFLTIDGVNVLRSKQGSLDIDTLAYALKPLSQAEFEAKYGSEDDQASIVMGVLYGEGRKGSNQTEDPPGSMGASVELNSEQDISFGFAMLVADWRTDLAQDMAVGLIDRTAKPGEVYEYIVQPTVWDNGGKIIFEPGVRSNVVNRTYKPTAYDPELDDTLVSPRRFVLSWVDETHGSWEVERRYVGRFGSTSGTGEWERINEKPYVPMIETDFEGLCLFNDSVTADGVWEYRIMAHDPFGELTEPSPVHRVYARDIEPPIPPQIKKFAIIREDIERPMKKVLAAVIWENPEEQMDDCTGYMVYYQNNQMTGDQWIPLPHQTVDVESGTVGESTNDLISPADTIAIVDVTGLRTGMMALRAYDDSGNESVSVAQMIRVNDYKAPDVPDSLQALVLSNGCVILKWNPSPDDDVAGYDVAFANDTTHTFLRLNNETFPETAYVDSLALDVNQKYIYYKVRAVDWSTNISDWSHWIEVKRPHISPPTQPHLDKSSHDDEKGMYMRWVVGPDADMDHHVLWRRVGDKGDWEELQRWDADSLAKVGKWTVDVYDNPRHNRQERYYYMVESFNSSPFTSQSLAVSWLHQGPKYFDIPIKLYGAHNSGGLVRLTWDLGELPEALRNTPYYYCVFRRLTGQKSFSYVMNVEADKSLYEEKRLNKDEEAEYYVLLHFSDGRESHPSNVVTVRSEK